MGRHGVRRGRVLGFQTVHFASHIEQHRVGFRGVEVIVHRLDKACFEGFAARRIDGFVGTAQRSIQTLQRRTRLLEVLFAIVQLAAIVAGHQEVANGLGIVILQHVADGKEVAQRFRHLLAVDHHHAGVHPVVNVLAVMGAGGLSDFVFVMREHQIGTAAVNVKMVAQLFAVHRRALDMPSRTACAPRRRPAWLALFRHLPQDEVHRITLDVNHVDARPRLQLIEILTRQQTVVRVCRHIEHYVAVIRHIGMAFGDQLLGNLDDLRNMMRRARLAVGTQNIQGVKILVHFGDHPIDQRDKAFAVFISALNDFVVDIGDIAHVLQLIAEKTQITRHNVKRDEGTPMADVTEIVNGNTTHVHADFPGMDRFKFLFLARQCIKNF